jgi:hypothetical protein
MKIGKKWVVAFCIATAGVIGGAGAVTATTAEDTPLTGEAYKVTSHEGDDESSDNQSDKGDKDNKSNESDNSDDSNKGESDDKGDDDASDVNDTDGPGDDEDD